MRPPFGALVVAAAAAGEVQWMDGSISWAGRSRVVSMDIDDGLRLNDDREDELELYQGMQKQVAQVAAD